MSIVRNSNFNGRPGLILGVTRPPATYNFMAGSIPFEAKTAIIELYSMSLPPK